MPRFFCRASIRAINVVTVCLCLYQSISGFLNCYSNGPKYQSRIFRSVQSFNQSESNNENLQSHQFNLMDKELFEYMANFLNNKKKYPGISIYTDYMVALLGKKLLVNAQPIISRLDPILNVSPRRGATATEATYCRFGSLDRNQVSLFVAVISAPTNVFKRKAIRDTWFHLLSDEVNSIRIKNSNTSVLLSGVAFVVGRSENHKVNNDLKEEIGLYKDILQVDMTDTYYNITTKVVGLLKWLCENCTNVDFVLKVDDDVYVNVRNLGSFIRKLRLHQQPGVYGVLTQHTTPQRGKGKWNISYKDYPWKTYPNFFYGGAILIAGSAVELLLTAAQTVPHFQFDDVFLTGFCAERANVTLWTVDGFLDEIEETAVPQSCFIFNTITWIVNSSEQMEISHQSAEKFYSNETHCRRRDGPAIDSSKVINFSAMEV